MWLSKKPPKRGRCPPNRDCLPSFRQKPESIFTPFAFRQGSRASAGNETPPFILPHPQMDSGFRRNDDQERGAKPPLPGGDASPFYTPLSRGGRGVGSPCLPGGNGDALLARSIPPSSLGTDHRRHSGVIAVSVVGVAYMRPTRSRHVGRMVCGPYRPIGNPAQKGVIQQPFMGRLRIFPSSGEAVASHIHQKYPMFSGPPGPCG